ncbi:MAG: SusC/RagA family TonB-linked outer membrane protein, partial [Bacteroidia bacterium]|nr:SusC/RagA family TonB-linked outer membrane protein [Bacteroidia bacterium]
TPTRLPEFLNSFDMATLLNAGLRNDNKPELYSATDLQKFKDGSSPNTHPNTDWFDLGLNNSAPTQQYNLNVSGGADKIRYFLSLGFLDQKGLYNNVGYKRYNFRSNIDVDATATTNIKLDIAGRFEERDNPYISATNGRDDIFYSLVRIRPTVVGYFTNGLPNRVPGAHPVEATDRSGYRKNRNYVLMNTLSITQKIPFVSGLSFKGVLAYDKAFNFEKQWATPYTVYEFNPTTDVYNPVVATVASPVLAQYNNDNYNSTIEAHINYERVFGNHSLKGLVLFSQNSFDYNAIFAGRRNFLSSAIDEIGAGPAATAENGGESVQRARRGWVGRINYDLMNKYFIEANFRYDASENFPKNSRWGFFPSVSAGWRISDEAFFTNSIKAIDYLKIRGSWGQLGNDKLNAQTFLYYSTYNYAANYSINNQLVQTIAEARIGNPNITWETATSFNVGLEGAALKNKLNFEFDYFKKRTSDILGARNLSIPGTSGIGGNIIPTENLIIVENQGFEFNITYNNNIGKNFRYNVSLNYTRAKNELILQMNLLMFWIIKKELVNL